MKTFKILFWLGISILVSNVAIAQINVGIQGSYLRLFNDVSPTIRNIGTGIRVDYFNNGKTHFNGNFNYYFPSDYPNSTGADALDMGTIPSSISLSTTEKVTLYQGALGVRRYFIGNHDNPFGLYGLLEGGLLVATFKVDSVEPYDESLYDLRTTIGQIGTLKNFTLNGGLGLETKLPFGSFFGEAKLVFPSNEFNDNPISIELPPALIFNIGLRIHTPLKNERVGVGL